MNEPPYVGSYTYLTMMTSTQIRQSFLDFFKSKQHTIVPSSSLMPDAPNLLFTNAGMNQFVPIFLGQTKCPYTPGRAADSQKCIRAGGKHNDLEDVGLDTYHHTFFEMLGNWSFCDYFKKEAIAWAWELVVENWKFPADRLYATVYKPGDGEPSEFDQEAYDHWEKLFAAAGLDPKIHICTSGKKDNFWMMGDTGPCGPCSELHVDLTPNGDTKGSLVNMGDARCIEIWNLVFIQYNANPDGSFSPLPARHVDTGMGFERVTSIIQGTKNFTDFAHAKISNYETDVFRPIFDALENLSGKKYTSTLPATASQPTVGGAHAPSRVPDRALAVGTDARPRASSVQSAAATGTIETKYSRRNLPHFERPWAKYMVTFTTRERRKLTSPERDLVLKSILYAQEHRQIQLYAACVMPDHVHLLFEPQIKEQGKDGKPVFWPLSEILQGIKSASAHNINKAFNQTGHVWEQESMDRMIRGQTDLEEKFHYICRNPWESGVVQITENYPWLWTPEPRAEARVGAVDEASTAAREARALPPLKTSGEAPSNIIEVEAKEAGPHPGPASDSKTTPADTEGLPTAEQVSIDIAFRVIADHIRTLGFAIADGIQPGVKKRNSVLRSIHKRMARFASTIGIKDDLLLKTQDVLVDTLAENMGDVFPEVRAQKGHIKKVLRQEADVFNKTLDRGLQIFEQEVRLEQEHRANELIEHQKLQAQGQSGFDEDYLKRPVVSGAMAFTLYDTYGFPLDLTELMARERGLTVDKEGFNKLMDEQKKRSQAAQKKEVISVSQIETTTPTKFVGYEKLETPAKVLEVVSLKNKTAVVLDTSACYAEMGGQVGDTGELKRGTQLWRITNTQKSGNAWLHIIDTGSTRASRVSDRALAVGPDARQRASSPSAETHASAVDEASTTAREARALPEPESAVTLSVDKPRRESIQRHHTVTHLLHWALHEVVSKEASQKGSFVGPEKLTFDFNSQPLTPQQVADVEKLVNERILENAGVSWTEVPYADVKSRKDVMQFFGEKYGNVVRVVQIGGHAARMDGYSMELCGGTHTRATGEIGLFRIVGESAIAAGVRRIEAIAGLEAYRNANNELQLIKSLAGKVNSPVHELDKKIEALLEHQKSIEKQLKSAQQREASNAASRLLEEIQKVNDIPLIIHNLGSVDGDFLQSVADSLKERFKGVIVLGGGSHAGSVSLVAAVTPDYAWKIQAGKIMQHIAPMVGGKGGGRPDNARGGGKNASKLDEALGKVKGLLGA